MSTTTSPIVSARVKIGMEIHVELATRSKMFTRVANVAHPDFFDAKPNSLVDPVVAALPGALPVMNRAAVEMSMMVGHALNCQIAEFTKWDRKNYFYPDLPKGYQISQYDLPLCSDGALDITSADGTVKRIGIIRAHLEEDAGKLGHELPGGHPYEGSLVDLNRAGTPLLEIVTQPDLTDADDAVVFAKELRSLCRFLGVTEGIMQRGHMRFEPNVNVIIVTEDGRELATPIAEIKNLNSFRAVKLAVEYEHRRQIEAWKEDGRIMEPGTKSTYGWDDDAGRTVLQREKEEANDYRYFPDPDLVPVVISAAWRDEVAARVPELPMQRRARYENDLGLSPADALALTEDPGVCSFFEQCHEAAAPATSASSVAKVLRNTGAKHANERGVSLHELGITPTQVAAILALRDANEIGSTAADELFALLCATDDDARSVADHEGLLQVQDEGQLNAWVATAVSAHPQAADDFAAGKDAAAGRLIGEIMKCSQGKADAKAARAKLIERLR